MVKVFDSELKLMKILWSKEKATAKELAALMKEDTGWSKTTTYTVIKKCVDKGAIRREEPHFMCIPVFSKEEVQEYETEELIGKMYDGKAGNLVCALVSNKKMAPEELRQIRALIDSMDS